MMNFDQIHSFLNTPILSLTKNSSGRRLAVLTLDNIISFFSLNEFKKYEFEGPSSQLITSHKGSQIKFAPSEYGSILALSDLDGGIHLYEEIKSKNAIKKNWSVLKEFIFPEEKILDFKFSPMFQGFQFAVASSFGILRVYQNQNNLEFNHWELICEETVTVNRKGIKSISWCKNPFFSPMIAVLCEYEFSEHERNVSRAEIFLYVNNGDNWKMLDKLPSQYNYYRYAEDITWSNNLGKTYESIVCCGEDGVYIWNFWLEDGKIKIKDMENVMLDGEEGSMKKVNWNPNGQIISCIDEKNTVFLCKEMSEKWRCVYKFEKK